MDNHSPFAQYSRDEPKPTPSPSGVVHVLFCGACYHVWKAPAETKICINCKGNGETVVSLINYKPEIPIL